LFAKNVNPIYNLQFRFSGRKVSDLSFPIKWKTLPRNFTSKSNKVQIFYKQIMIRGFPKTGTVVLAWRALGEMLILYYLCFHVYQIFHES